MTQDPGNSLRRISPVAALRESTDFQFDFSARTDDFAKYDTEIGRRSRRDAAGSEHVLVQQAPAGMREDLSLTMDDESEELLKDAWFNVGENDFATALELLEELLALEADHAEALYLAAYCHYRLGGDGPMRALRLLSRLRDRQLEHGLAGQVRDLRTELRRILTQGEIDAFNATESSDPEAAAARLREFTELVPEEGLPFVLLARALATGRRYREALSTALAGAATSETDRDLCSNLAIRLALQLRVPPAQPAVVHFRAGRYREARQSLAELPPEWRNTQVIEDFDAYLATVQGHPATRALPVPALQGTRADSFHSLIAEADVNAALELLTAGAFEEGERRLAALLRSAPGYAWLHFLYAVCLFVQRKNLEVAEAEAEAAMRDPSLGEASLLRDAIRNTRDALLVNPLVEEFLSAWKSAQEPEKRRTPSLMPLDHSAALASLLGGPAPDPLAAGMAKAKSRLVALQTSVARTRGATVTDAGADTVRQLGDLLVRRISQLDVALLVRKFNQCMEALNAGSRTGISPYDLNVSELRDVKRKAEGMARNVMDPEDTKLLSELRNALTRIGL